MTTEMKTVKMQDGRNQTFGKSQKVKKSVIYKGDVPVAVRFDGVNGDTDTFTLDNLPESVRLYSIAHGQLQKLGDEYADVDTVEECFIVLRNLWARLVSGSWDSETRAGDGGILVQAIVKALGVTAEIAREQLELLKPKEVRALRGIPEIAEAIQAIEIERGKGINLDELKKKFAA